MTIVGDRVGAGVGGGVGVPVGDNVGACVGCVGGVVGRSVGVAVGNGLGAVVGVTDVGTGVGLGVGAAALQSRAALPAGQAVRMQLTHTCRSKNPVGTLARANGIQRTAAPKLQKEGTAKKVRNEAGLWHSLRSPILEQWSSL